MLLLLYTSGFEQQSMFLGTKNLNSRACSEQWALFLGSSTNCCGSKNCKPDHRNISTISCVSAQCRLAQYQGSLLMVQPVMISLFHILDRYLRLCATGKGLWGVFLFLVHLWDRHSYQEQRFSACLCIPAKGPGDPWLDLLMFGRLRNQM